MVYYKLHEPGFLSKHCLLYFISNSLLNSWLLCTFSEKDISPMNAFYFRSACFSPSSKILKSDYQTGFNELRVGVLLSCDYPVPRTSFYPAALQSRFAWLPTPPMLNLEWLQSKLWLLFFKSPSPQLVLDICSMYKPTNKHGL